MIPITPIFQDFLKKRDRIWDIKVDINGVEYDSSSIVDFNIDFNIASNDEFTLGTANISKLVLRMRTMDEIAPNAKVIPYISLSLENMTWDDADYAWDEADFPWNGTGTTEWLSLGHFYIDNREQVNDIWVYECYDQLVFADIAYISSLTYPASMQDVWDELMTRTGLSYDSGSVAIDPSYTLPVAPSGYTCRQVMSFIAMANSASVYSGRDGLLKFKQFGSSDSTVYELTPSDYMTVTQTNPVKTYTKVVVMYDDEDQLTYESGNGDDNHTLYLYNPIMAQNMVDDLLASINGMAYMPIDMQARGFPQLESGDRIQFGRIESMTWNQADISWDDADFPWDGIINYETIILNQSFGFAGGLSMGIKSPSESEQASEFAVEGSLTQQVNRLTQNAVRKGKTYFGVTITDDDGLTIERSDHKSKLILNSDEMDWQVDGVSSLYYDAIDNRIKFTGTLEGVDGIFSGKLQGGEIEIGSGNNVFKADSNGIWAGDADFNNAPFSVNMQGELYAEDAEISGTITGSDIIGGTITGALIQTKATGYPRIELSSSSDILTVEASSSSLIEIDALGIVNIPVMSFKDGSGGTFLYQGGDTFTIASNGEMILQAPDGIKANGVNITSEISNLQSRMSNAESDINSLENDVNNLEDDVNDLEDELDDKITAGTGGSKKINYINASGTGLVIWFTDGTNATVLYD